LQDFAFTGILWPLGLITEFLHYTCGFFVWHKLGELYMQEVSLLYLQLLCMNPRLGELIFKTLSRGLKCCLEWTWVTYY